MPIAHTSLAVANLEAGKAFYSAVLAPLNYKVGAEFPRHIGYGIPGGKNDFWLFSSNGQKVPPVHTAFYGESEEMVKGFHAASL